MRISGRCDKGIDIRRGRWWTLLFRGYIYRSPCELVIEPEEPQFSHRSRFFVLRVEWRAEIARHETEGPRAMSQSIDPRVGLDGGLDWFWLFGRGVDVEG